MMQSHDKFAGAGGTHTLLEELGDAVKGLNCSSCKEQHMSCRHAAVE